MSDTTTEAPKAPSLPQHDTEEQRAIRLLELIALGELYQYEHWTGLPMPMATLSSAITASIFLGSWFVGQAKNLARIGVNFEIWKVLRSLGTNDRSLDDIATALGTIFESPLLRHLRQ